VPGSIVNARAGENVLFIYSIDNYRSARALRESLYILIGFLAKFSILNSFVCMSAASMTQPNLTRDLLEHRQALLGFIYALTRDFDAAEEIFQETALAILAEAAAGRQVDPFLPWAREVARNRFSVYVRAKGRRVAVMSPELLDVVAQAFRENDDIHEAPARPSQLAACLEELTERVRRMLNQRYQGGRSVPEIAREMGWTVDAVHVALSRARRALGDCVDRKTRLEAQG
jgi:RNA polymerase sigma-70 factor, ECF subfamily